MNNQTDNLRTNENTLTENTNESIKDKKKKKKKVMIHLLFQIHQMKKIKK